MDTRNRSLWLVWIVPAVALIVALADLPYGYYTLLRITVTICAGVLVYTTYQSRGTLTPAILLFGGIALRGGSLLEHEALPNPLRLVSRGPR